MEDSQRAMARFRNRLVHVYWHVDDDLIADASELGEDKDDMFEVIETVKEKAKGDDV